MGKPREDSGYRVSSPKKGGKNIAHNSVEWERSGEHSSSKILSCNTLQVTELQIAHTEYEDEDEGGDPQ